MKKVLSNIQLGAVAFASGGASCIGHSAEEPPIMKIGIVSDVQALPSRHDWGMRNLSLALDRLKNMQIDVLLNTGDLAEDGNPETFKLYWDLIEERFGKDKIVHIACEGNHEFNHPTENRFQEICKGLRRSTENPLCVNVKGYDFIVFSYYGGKFSYSKETLSRLDAALRESAKREPSKPIFLLSHFPPAGTMSGCFAYEGAQTLRNILNQYPQVVSLSGHTHYPLNDRRCFWQGEFSAFTCGTLSYGCMDGNLFNCHNSILPFAREAVQFLRMDVFTDRLEIHRYNAIEGTEISPKDLWIIRLPYDPAATRPEIVRSAPAFANDAKLLTRYDYGFMYVIFDRPVKGDFAHFYDVEIAEKKNDGSFAAPSCVRYAGDFYRLEKNRQDMVVLKLPGKDMKDAAWYRIRVYPVESSGKRGIPLELLEYTWPGYPFRDGKSEYPQE